MAQRSVRKAKGKTAVLVIGSRTARGDAGLGKIPHYLVAHYWWAYLHPKAVAFFDRPWLINLILCGNYRRLRDAALAELEDPPAARTLQVACVYGDLSIRLSERLAARNGALDVVDVLKIQLRNLRNKLPAPSPVRLHAMDASDLDLPAASYDQVLLFFLLHEQPRDYRKRTLQEALRVVRPGGKIVVVDYGKPRWWHPLRYLLPPFLAKLEPFALDLWKQEIADLVPAAGIRARKEAFFGGLYQKVVVTAAPPAAGRAR